MPAHQKHSTPSNSKRDVDAEDVLGRHVRAWHHLLAPVGGFGLEQAHAADTQQRQDRHRHADETDAAEPVQQRGAR